jgi:hypothetical protein
LASKLSSWAFPTLFERCPASESFRKEEYDCHILMARQNNAKGMGLDSRWMLLKLQFCRVTVEWLLGLGYFGPLTAVETKTAIWSVGQAFRARIHSISHQFPKLFDLSPPPSPSDAFCSVTLCYIIDLKYS